MGCFSIFQLISSGAPSQPAATRAQPKGVLHSQYQATTAPQTPPKKGTGAGRGVPPPIPPNKPVIPIKQSTGRRPESGETDKKKASGSKEAAAANAAAAAAPSGGEGARSGTQGIEILGQELADFQQMFVTMATSNNT